MRKKTLVDPVTGELRGEMNPLAIDEDIYIPIRPNATNRVEKLAGSNQVDRVLDIDYMRKRFYGCVRVPADYLGFSDAEGGLLGRSPLYAQDIQFARSCKRLQRAMMVGYARMFEIDLCFRGINPLSLENEFWVQMCPISYLEEVQRAEVAKVRASIVETLMLIGEKLQLDQMQWMKHVMRVAGLEDEITIDVNDQVATEAGFQGKRDLTEGDKTLLEQILRAPMMKGLLTETLYYSRVSNLQISRDPIPDIVRR